MVDRLIRIPGLKKRLGLNPIPCVSVRARKTRRAEDGSPLGLSYMVWAERMATKQEILEIIDALNDIDMKASAQVVWRLLVDADNWSSALTSSSSARSNI